MKPGYRLGTGVFVGSWEVGSTDWHTARLPAVGGSEVAALLGLSPWISRFGLWHRKVGNVSSFIDSPILRRGHDLEPLVRASLRSRIDRPLWNHPGTWIHTDRPWQLANPDGLLPGSARRGRNLEILEVKTTHAFDAEWGEEGTDQVPGYYLVQARWYLDVFDADECLLVCRSVTEWADREYLIGRHAGDEEEMRRVAVEFVETLPFDGRPGIPPDIDDHSDTFEVLRRLHPDVDGTSIEVAPELADKYRVAASLSKTADSLKARASTRLLEAMGDAEWATVNGSRVAQRRPPRAGYPPTLYPAKGLATALPFINHRKDVPV